MENREHLIKSTVEHSSELLAKLRNGDAASENECSTLIAELKDLQQHSTQQIVSKEEVRMITDIENQLSLFNTHADNSRQLLNDMLSAISEGRVPKKQQLQELNISIEDLQQQYDLIYTAARQACSDQEIPEADHPVHEYAEALKNSRTILLRKQIAAAKACLQSFIAVKSEEDSYAKPLSPYQLKAQRLLERICSGELMEISELEKETKAPKMLLEAIEYENPAVVDEGKLMQRLSQIYSDSPMIAVGAAAKRYYLDPDTASNRLTAESIEEPISEENPDNQPAADPARQTAEAEQIMPEESADKPSRESGMEKEASAFVQRLVANNGFIAPDENVSEMIAVKDSNEDKKISSKIFTNDIRMTNTLVARAIVAAVTGSHFVTLDYLAKVEKIPESIAAGTLEFFFKKGYLHRYDSASGGTYYCASPRLIKALSYKDARNYVGCSKQNAERWAGNDSIEAAPACIAARAALSDLYTATVGRFAAAKIKTYSESISMYAEAFLMNVHTAGSRKDCELVIGAFWTAASECDILIEALNAMLSHCEDIINMTFAGYTKRLAQVLADAVTSTVDCSDQKPAMYLYASSEQRYYSYPALDAVQASDIQHTFPPEAHAAAETADQPEEESLFADAADNMNETELLAKAEPPAAVAETEKAAETDGTHETTAPEGHAVKAAAAIDTHAVKAAAAIDTHAVKAVAAIDTSACFNTLYEIIQSGKLYAAAAYMKACALANPSLEEDYLRLAYAVNDPMAHCSYSSDNVFNLIANQNDYNDSLIIATAIRTFFSNQIRYDYNIKSFYNAIKEYSLLNRFSTLSRVVYTIMDFKDTQKKGLDAYADYHARSKAELDAALLQLRQDAKSFYDSFIASRKTESVSLKRFVEMKRLLYAANGDIGTYVKAVYDNDSDSDSLTLVQDFLRGSFFKDGSNLSEDAVDSGMLWSYICTFWEKAGDNMTCKRHVPLVSHLKTNVISTTTKAVQLLVRWCNICETINSGTEDEGAQAYTKMRAPLLANIAEADTEIYDYLQTAEASIEEKAGLSVVCHALDEIRSCVEAEFDEEARRFFYAPFMLTDDVVLDEQYIPDFDLHGTTLEVLQPQNRVLNHLSSLARAGTDYDSRISEIMEGQEDNYGTASLIAEYLFYKNSSYNIKEMNAAIASSRNYARETADLRRQDFIGELELAQSYGQIDNSVEDRKERILQVVNLWYDWAVDSCNYGFFKKVLDCYLAQIRESAKPRERDLLEQLSKFQELTVPGMSTVIKENRIAAIRSMISKQNYTVAEDLLARAANMEDEHEVLAEEDFLKDFLDNYDDYYRPVSFQRSSFASLVSSRTRNKEERGAKRLADNWLPGGSKLGGIRLENLLTCLGFKIASIVTQMPIDKFENFIVTTSMDHNGHRINYAHPIAAFGSGATLNGFRVVCINGVYDANGLIDVMKQIGSAKHTMVLLDCALQKSERRILARKSKHELGDKLFGVVDRVTMMFMIRNYDATKINRMLISLITPFGYCQPYVWESANSVPPEMFMGRKRELERIESPTGVNVVYGGRQLGKTALLKKAKEDIDHDENGDRAIYISIWGKTQEDACRKIGHELHDQGILDTDLNTTDWNALARAVKRRLQAKEKHIPYLLLLLDEADAFIDSCESINYRPFDALKDIQSVGTERFKFVIAGLRNIVRFKREAALGNNSVLTHLQSMTVKPFDTSEARELLEIPLRYLGLRFPAGKESLIALILATTNYFPGLIQLYCAKLLAAMRNMDYAGYNEVDTPIYEVSEEHIKKVLADPEFMRQIREKFIITLKLGEDDYYFLIALLLAYLYHSNGYHSGYAAVDIKNVGTDLEISKIAQLEDHKLAAFMEELCELNVLRKTDNEHYLFTRFTFFQMMGTATEIDNSLEAFMGE